MKEIEEIKRNEELRGRRGQLRKEAQEETEWRHVDLERIDEDLEEMEKKRRDILQRCILQEKEEEVRKKEEEKEREMEERKRYEAKRKAVEEAVHKARKEQQEADLRQKREREAKEEAEQKAKEEWIESHRPAPGWILKRMPNDDYYYWDCDRTQPDANVAENTGEEE